MNGKKADLVIEAVHHKRDGQIDYVRAYQKRGAAYSDCFLMKRRELVQLIVDGLLVEIGQRVPSMGNTFSTRASVGLLTINQVTIITAGSAGMTKIELAEAPII
jgi:hypothetical protein